MKADTNSHEKRAVMQRRLTQKERSAATKRKFLDAAARVLVEAGYTNLTTTRVCREAGMSQGALFKHFPTKTGLVSALAEDLYKGLADEYEALFEAEGKETDLIRKSIRNLWTVFSSQRQMASYDLTMAARTDPELRNVMEDAVRKHRERIEAIAEKIRIRLGMEKPLFNPLADLILMAVQGGAVNTLAFPDPEATEKRLNYLENLAGKAAGLSRKGPL